MVHTEQSTRATPATPATLADVLLRLGSGLEILPEPLTVEHHRSDGRFKLQLHTLADWEAWRQWSGAPPAQPGEWTPAGNIGMSRRYITSAVWRGRTIELLYLDFRWDQETPAERRDRLARELDQLDQEIAARAPELAKC